MKYYEPYQRLSFVYIKGDSAVYVKSSLSVLMPAGLSLFSRDTEFNASFEAKIEYYLTINNAIRDPYVFEQERSIKFFTNKELSQMTDLSKLKLAIGSGIEANLAKSGFCSLTSLVYNDKGNLTGQVTNTISNQDAVVIL